MRQQLFDIQERAIQAIASLETLDQLQHVKAKYLGKKSVLNTLLKEIGSLAPAERAEVGQLANLTKKTISEQIEKQVKCVEKKQEYSILMKNKQDISMPGWKSSLGTYHVLYREMKRIEAI